MVFCQSEVHFYPLRYNDDFSYLEGDSSKNTYGKIKYIPISDSKKYFLSLGGEIRGQYINTKNNKWGDEQDDPNGYFLTRFLVHTDLKLGALRLFGQLQSSLAYGLPHPSPVDLNQLDLHQLFFDYKFFKEKDISSYARVGRQEMSYGSKRLIGEREGPNSRLSMDGVKFVFSKKDIQLDAFYLHPVKNISGFFNDEFNTTAKLWGGYSVANKVRLINNIDLYYIGSWNEYKVFDNAQGKEIRHTFGTRIWGVQRLLNYDIELAYQLGKLGDNRISAYTVSANLNYRFDQIRSKPVLGLKSEIISGDKSSKDNSVETFNPLYPRGAYFGLVALIGPVNLYDVHPSIEFELNKKLNFQMDYDFFWRWSRNDGIYSSSIQLLYSGEGIYEKYIGSQLGADIDYNIEPHISMTIEGAWFNAGSFLKAAGQGKDYFYYAFTSAIKF